MQKNTLRVKGKHAPNGKRGDENVEGWWVSFAEAKMHSFGEEWWKTQGCNGLVVPATQHDPSGPSDKPVWLYKDKDMYLGEWKMQKTMGRAVEDGFGVVFNAGYAATPSTLLHGSLFIGWWKDRCCHGSDGT